MKTLKTKRSSDKSIGFEEFAVHRMIINATVRTEDYIIAIRKTVENTTGALTTSYGNDLEGQLNKTIQKSNVTDNQLSALQVLVTTLLELEKINSTSFNTRIEVATDNEIVISRRSSNGISIISVDSFGDIMVNFAGYVLAGKTNFYDFSDYDPEAVVFDFLHP
jgi:hypothetical protein